MTRWVKVLASKPEEPGTHMVEGENQLQKVVLLTSTRVLWRMNTLTYSVSLNRYMQ